MTIIIESIFKNKKEFENISEADYSNYRSDYLNSQYNTIRCKIDEYLHDETYCTPKGNIWLNDAIGFSDNMLRYQKYECVLEIESFSKVALYTNHNYSIRGIWRKKVPSKYLPKYSLFKEQCCIEIGKDIILFSPYSNNWISNIVIDGELIEIICQSNLNIKYAQLIDI